MSPDQPTGSSRIRVSTTTIRACDGQDISVLLAEPTNSGIHPAIVIGAEAMGLNTYTREVAEHLAELGFVVAAPDYYRGKGPSRPDDYTDFSEVFTAIADLDFRAAAYDQLATADWLRARSDVDSSRVFVWGYCTGGTLSMMAACLDRRLAGAVLFFPSQPMFETLTAKRPSHPMDLVWNIACPILVLYGDKDYLMSAERLALLRHRLEKWSIEHKIVVYEGAGHAFTAPSPAMHHAAAAAASWDEAVSFVLAHTQRSQCNRGR